MKKQLLTIIATFITGSAMAQAVVHDKVTIGAGYANQIWYSLQNDEQGSAQAKGNWDIAFNLKDLTAGIMVNTASGVELYGYPKSDLSGWASVDTNGLSTWEPRYNSDESWVLTAMGNYADPGNSFDLDWGIYDLSTHQVTGDSLYIIKTVSGAYKKLAIESLISGVFTFKYADLDGNNEQTKTVAKSSFTDKNFGYFDLSAGSSLDREPAAATWDLLFTPYTAFPMGMAYTVTGILSNRGVTVAKAENVTDVTTYQNWFTETFSDKINTIGSGWKTYDMGSGTYKVAEKEVYFVKTAAGDVWKLVFTGFDMNDGGFEFDKQKLATASIGNDPSAKAATMSLYPNPSNAQNVTVVYSWNKGVKNADLKVYDVAGKMVHTAELVKASGLHQYVIPSTAFSAGMYSVIIDTEKGRMQQKMIIK